MKKSITLIFLYCVLVIPSFARQSDQITTSMKLVEESNHKILSLLREQSNNTNAKNALEKIMRDYFDMDAIGKFVLGVHGRQANEQEKQEFLQLFHEVLAADYASQFGKYNNESVVIQNSKPGNAGGIVVSGVIKRPNGPSTELHWIVRQKEGKEKIYDVIVEGVSMAQTLRSEYDTRFIQSGETMRGLLKKMREDLKKNSEKSKPKNQ